MRVLSKAVVVGQPAAATVATDQIELRWMMAFFKTKEAVGRKGALYEHNGRWLVLPFLFPF